MEMGERDEQVNGVNEMNYLEFVKEHLGAEPCENNKYCDVGHSFHVSTDEAEGSYWFYETDSFIIDIHDFFIKKEVIRANFLDMRQFMSFYSSYIVSANGESFNPYQTLSANSLYIIDANNEGNASRFLLHGNFPYLGVGIYFKKEMIDEYMSSLKKRSGITYSDVFFNTKSVIGKPLESLVKDILNCKMSSPAAEIFFEAKAKEWLSITINAFVNKNSVRISADDDEALKNVASYLDDHYAISVPQGTLEKIAMMSGTKLKKLFKQKYQLSITEYSQRRRMNIAETLLINSSLKIQDIAKSVGYSSHSKFSACFKKYKGIYPRELKKITSDKTPQYGKTPQTD